MDFFEHQEVAKKKTSLLVFLFALACICIVVTIYAAATLIFYAQDGGYPLFNPELFLAVLGGVVIVVGGGSIYKISRLQSGGPAVATLLGGRPISISTTDPLERRLLNVVEEMSIASGVPVPEVYVLQDEDGINAFAAGTGTVMPSDTIIGVTRGCLEHLNREELQGVIGHEFSHILSGDMRLNLRLMGLVHGILVIGLIGNYIVRSVGRSRSRSRRSKGVGQIILLGLVLMAVGFIGTAFGNMIKAAVSRQREYLADASSVQFTRNPNGLANALAKIGGLQSNGSGSMLTAKAAHQASHFYFAQGVKPWMQLLFATHPPLEDRIQRIAPYVELQPPQHPASGSTSPAGTDTAVPHLANSSQTVPKAERQSRSGHPSQPGERFPSPTHDDQKSRKRSYKPDLDRQMLSVIQSVGLVRPEHLDYAQELLGNLPPMLKEASREAFTSTCLIYALLLDQDQAIRQGQYASIRKHSGEDFQETTRIFHSAMQKMNIRCRPLLVELALTTLARSTMSHYTSFKTCVRELIHADQRMNLFEWMVNRSVLHNLADEQDDSGSPGGRISSLSKVREELSGLLSVLARSGSRKEENIRQSFELGAMKLGIRGIELHPAERYTLRTLDQSLNRLMDCVPALKKIILTACAACIASDKWVNQNEGELLRAISMSLGCPMPLLLPGQALI